MNVTPGYRRLDMEPAPQVGPILALAFVCFLALVGAVTVTEWLATLVTWLV